MTASVYQHSLAARAPFSAPVGKDAAASPPETWVSPADGSTMRLIPGGEFLMGSAPAEIEAAKSMDRDGRLFAVNHETPQFHPNLPAYYLGVYAVTNAQFARFLNATRTGAEAAALWLATVEHLVPPVNEEALWRADVGYENHPVAHVSWPGADAYCRWAGLRLPTEIEWEKGARGSDGRIYPWGNEWREDLLRWYGGDRGENETTAPVDAYPAGCSPYGLFQMAGNVDEWCADAYQPAVYRRYSRGDLHQPNAGYGSVVRGGACMRRSKLEFRCAMRRGNPSVFVNILFTGFRCACDATVPTQLGLSATVSAGAPTRRQP